jgi:hypothetical protein
MREIIPRLGGERRGEEGEGANDVAPAIIGPMPGMVILVERVTLPASSGCPLGVVNSSANLLGPCFRTHNMGSISGSRSRQGAGVR